MGAPCRFLTACTILAAGCLGPEPQYGTGGTGGAGGTTGTVAPGELGAPCNSNLDCNSFDLLVCVDDLCCTVCNATCESCAESRTGQPDGECSPVLVNTDPAGDCSSSAEMCDGDGSCKLVDGESCNFDSQCISDTCETVCASP